MRLFSGPAAGVESNVSRKQHTPSHQQSSTTSSRMTRSTATTRSMAWSLLCTLIVLNTFLAFLSPSTSGGRALAALESGFCADCKTFSNAIGVCGGTFGPADIEKPGEYVLVQDYAKCTCTAVMQKVLWTCAKCEFLAGKGSSGVPPKKHQMTCMGWGITVEQYAAPYTGVVEPGTTTDLGGGTTNPPATATTTNPLPTTGNPKPSSDGGNKPSGTTTDPTSPSSSHDNLNGDNNTSGNGSSGGPNTAAIGISCGIIGVALVAGVMAVVMMKRRRRRRSPLDLDSSPALANFAALEDKWDTKPSRQSPTSPPLPPVPVASAAPVIGGRGNGRYGEGSVVGGGYDAQYDGHYDGYGHHGGYDAQYDAYGHGGQGGYGGGQQYDHYDQGGQYDQGRYDQGYEQGYHPGQTDAYQMHDYGYDQHVVAASQQPPLKGDAKRP